MSLVASKHADELRQTWQSRALHASGGLLRRVIICALAKEYPGVLETLLKVTFPGFRDLSRPIFTSYAHIALDGAIICTMIDRDGAKKKVKVFDNEERFIYQMRKLADGLKLADKDRVEMFTVLQKWVASDRRIGQFGQKLAS
jgi:hypothetical protein